MWRIPIPSLYLTYPNNLSINNESISMFHPVFSGDKCVTAKIPHRNAIRCSMMFNTRDVKTLKFIIIELLQILFHFLYSSLNFHKNSIHYSLFHLNSACDQLLYIHLFLPVCMIFILQSLFFFPILMNSNSFHFFSYCLFLWFLLMLWPILS